MTKLNLATDKMIAEKKDGIDQAISSVSDLASKKTRASSTGLDTFRPVASRLLVRLIRSLVAWRESTLARAVFKVRAPLQTSSQRPSS